MQPRQPVENKNSKERCERQNKTVNSNMIGKKGGTVKKLTGFPWTINGKRKEEGMIFE